MFVKRLLMKVTAGITFDLSTALKRTNRGLQGSSIYLKRRRGIVEMAVVHGDWLEASTNSYDPYNHLNFSGRGVIFLILKTKQCGLR